jgi:hypothetical protein
MALVHATERTAGPARPSRPSRSSYLAGALLMLATIVGGVRAAALFASQSDPDSLEIAGATWTVTDVAQVVGVAQRDLMNGMGHNIGGYVSDSQMMVRVSFVISAGDQRTVFDPSRLRVYEDGKSAPVLPMGGSLGAGTLSAHAHVEGTVTFVVPRDGGHLVLRAPGSPHDIDLATVDQAPQGATDEHQHTH